MATARKDPLERYRHKRDFRITPEPGAEPGADAARTPRRAGAVSERRRRAAAKAQALSFVVQKHWASHLHYDFRLELDGVLLSWAVPKGPSYDPKERRMAIQVEDHPLAYGGFEGTIPEKQYGAGEVIVWDQGSWEPEGDPHDGLRAGKLVFRLRGQKLAGLWQLVRTRPSGGKNPKSQWLLIKKHDGRERAHADYDVTVALPDSVIAKPLGLVDEREPMSASAPNGVRSGPGTVRGEVVGPQPDLRRAKKARLPASLAPQLATLVSATPPGEWVAEAKFDGYRLMARIDKGRPRLITRGGHDWTDRLPTVAAAVADLGLDNGWLDGEIVVLRADGAPDFNLLQNAIGRPGVKPGKRKSSGEDKGESDIVYFLFDVPFLNGHDLREVPLSERRSVLRALMAGRDDPGEGERLRFSEDFAVPPDQMLAAACQMRLEGLILKRPDGAYVSARSDSWVKLKCQQRQEFVVAGFTDRSDGAKAIGSLLLAYFDGETLVYAGRVGTGWSLKLAGELRRQLAALEVKRAHFSDEDIERSHWSRRATGDEHWVRPNVVVEVAFAEWTPEGHVRHASFQGVREDKPARAVRREAPVAASSVSAGPKRRAGRHAQDPDEREDTVPDDEPNPSRRKPKPPVKQSGQSADATERLRITHPERVIDPSTGLTKLALVRYYESVAEWLMPHLAHRPVALLRAPDGVDGQHFFQKHEDGDALIVIRDAAELLRFTQLNAIEFHTWNATDDRLDRPDRLVFDLDPGEGVSWAKIREGAQLVRALLLELGLEGWLKTSGGKGLHVVVPIARRLDHDAGKAFSQAVVKHLAETLPKRFVAKSGPKNRVGRIFVDYLRNGEGQTTVAAFSARARPGLGVSMPIHWDQLSDLKSAAEWTIATARDHLSFQREDPWLEYWSTKQTLGRAIKLLGQSD